MQICVQKLPKPDELLNVTARDFHRIDQCVAQQVFDSLNNSVWSSNGAFLWSETSMFSYSGAERLERPVWSLILSATYYQPHVICLIFCKNINKYIQRNDV
ncbi:hypothetical protein AMECASPLE_013860 [Ameca splendens]|uniref:Uncharacterized protein n=1 Tax=Ameca splendens TaxID=208324 RepID=A0ABV0YCN4_9TELE